MDVSQTIGDALRFHQAGDFINAEMRYRQVLARHPHHADALHLLGMLLHNRGHQIDAEQLIRQAIAVNPDQAVYHTNLGIVLAAAGKLTEACDAYRRASQLNPLSPEALNNLGVALHTAGLTTDAIDCFKRAIALRPAYTDAQQNLFRLLKIAPNTAAAFHTLADVLRQASHANEAIACYQSAIRLDPDHAPSHNNLANLLSEQGRLAEAIPAYLTALQLQPNSADLLSNLGNALREAGQRERAMECYCRAIVVDPRHARTFNNLGNFHCENADWPAAIDAYNQAIAIDPNFGEAINNLGTALEETGQRDEAMACYQRAKILSPESVSPPWNIALLQLLSGDAENGWRGYEHRWKQKKQCRSFRNFTQPMLSLAALRPGVKVLLHAEQGFGDAIQFCRYTERVAAFGVEVMVECPPPLVRLFSTLRGVSKVIAHGDPLPVFDLQCPMMSLPLVFRTRLQAANEPGSPDDLKDRRSSFNDVGALVPYLRADPADLEHWKQRFPDEPNAFRIGLVWAGGGNHQKDRQRSLNLSNFAGLAGMADVQFYSLQVGEKSAQAKAPPAGMRLTDWTDQLRDFADTAALISQLHLVIAVDTSVAHLAGALGTPVWILIPFQPDWRWLLDRTDSPWYPSAKLFRQPAPGRWDEPLSEIARTLEQLRVVMTIGTDD
jgi:tetratricopeptide (TPR) repeat protein